MPRRRSRYTANAVAPDPIILLWLLRILVPLGAHREFLRPDGFNNDALAEVIGLGHWIDPSADDFDPKAVQSELRLLYQKAEKQWARATPPACLRHGLDRLDPKLRDQAFDPGNAFSIPYLWGTTGIGVNSAAVDPATVTRWADLWRPEFRGRVMLTNDPREVFHVGLRVLGHSANTRDRAEIEAAYHKLVELMPSVRTFNSDAPRMPYLEGETDIGMIWNGEAATGREDLPTLTYVYPAEGAAIWMDSFVIPRNARNPEAAHRFIDFVLRPEIAALISAGIGYATPNLEARKLLDPEVAGNRTIHPQPEDLRNAEFQEDVGDQALLIYQEYWEKLKAGH